MKTNKKGISLIVLVITIIVMIILAAAIIVTLSQNGIIGRANEAKTLTNETQIKEAAQLAWLDAYSAGVRNVEGDDGLEAIVLAALTENGIDTTKYDIKVTTGGVSVAKKGDGKEDNSDLNPIGVIPEGAKYISADGTTYNAGDNFPTTLTPLDRYETEDYVYVYQAEWSAEPYTQTVFTNQFSENTSYDGWCVTTFGKTEKATYQVILESINGKNVTSMQYTFWGNGVIEVAPLIPKNINRLGPTFYYCRNLKQLSDGFSIPLDVTRTTQMFRGCSNLETLPTSFVIHENIASIDSMFQGCTSLKGTINIDANPTVYNYFLDNCDVSQITIEGKSTMKTELLDTAE